VRDRNRDTKKTRISRKRVPFALVTYKEGSRFKVAKGGDQTHRGEVNLFLSADYRSDIVGHKETRKGTGREWTKQVRLPAKLAKPG